MKKEQTNFGRAPRSSFLLLFIFFLELTVAASVSAGPKGLPFRMKSDGSVNLRDLMKLTRQPTARDRITDEELAVIKERHVIQYGTGFKPTAEPQMPARGDLYHNSTILTDGRVHTLLPKHSLLNVPDEHRRKVVEKPVGKLVLWPKFLKAHSEWLRTREVSLDEAKGQREMKPEQVEAIKADPRVVVGVLNRSPIGVLADLSGKETKETGQKTASPSTNLTGSTR